MNKRGQSEVLELTTLFEIVLGLVIAGFFIMMAFTFNQHTKFDKYYLEQDMKMLINTIQSAPNYVDFNYEHAKIYDISISENKIDVKRNLKITSLTKKNILNLKKDGPFETIKVKRNE